MLLRPARTKTVFLLAIGLAFTAIGILMVRAGEGITGWFCAVFFGIGAVVFVIQLLPGASYLKLTEDGFEVCSLFRRWPAIRWDSVSEFHAARVPGSRVRMVIFSRSSSQPLMAAVNRRLVGGTDALPDTYGRKPDELADLMNGWRMRVVG